MDTQRTSPWLHVLAVFTVAATLVLITLGSLVTTYRVAMADPIWPTTPWHLFTVSWQQADPGYLLEHAHRLAGYIVGILSIGLAVACWSVAARRRLRWLGVAALAGVSIQGLLGGFRVRLNEWLGTDLAVVHGSFAAIVLSLLAIIAATTSRRWDESHRADDLDRARHIWRLAFGLVVCIFVQIAFGAMVRHTYSSLAQRAHLAFAFVVTTATVWLVFAVMHEANTGVLRPLSCVLAAVVGLQILVGVEAWMIRYSAASTARQIGTRTIHVLLGQLALASAVVLASFARRRLGTPDAAAPDASDSLSPGETMLVAATRGSEVRE
ncbi:MAG: cytochrome aa3 oxidase assembly protein CtaA [Gemmatales bacterium]|nr:MAG: cytochrome aa3 oxidase assembly protein CtaA [Gemmatales bacterium]